jgi:hypothetical protein
MSADRLQTTPCQLHDAIETQIPFQYRAEVNVLFADLKSDVPIRVQDAIIRGHSVASRLKALAESQTTPGMFSDAEPSACLKVADYLYAAMDVAREKAPLPYSAGPVTDVASLPDSGAAYQAMVAHDTSAWRSVVAQPSVRQADGGQPTQLGDRDNAWAKMVEADENAWKNTGKVGTRS